MTERNDQARMIEKERAAFALQRVEDLISEDAVRKNGYTGKEIKSYVRRLPAMIRTNGFGQAMAFFYARRQKYPAYGAVYKAVEDWLCGQGGIYGTATPAQGLMPSSAALMKAITEGDQTRYLRAQAETRALMMWVKKFAEALVIGEEE